MEELGKDVAGIAKEVEAAKLVGKRGRRGRRGEVRGQKRGLGDKGEGDGEERRRMEAQK